MKKFKDVAHLYLGCVVEDENCPKGKVAVLDSVDTNGDCYVNYYDTNGNCNTDAVLGSVELFKPILRPLSDMTDDECKHEGMILNKLWQNYDKFSNRGSKDTVAEQIEYLLSRHFDLFGLIEAGESIDATTLENNPYKD